MKETAMEYKARRHREAQERIAREEALERVSLLAVKVRFQTGQKKSGQQKAKRVSVALCGTYSGYCRHLRLGETPCPPCKEACRLKSKARRARYRKQNPITLKPCGTYAAFLRHKRKNEPPCPECRKAKQEDDRKRHRDRKAKYPLGSQPTQKYPQCGTANGYNHHNRRGEKACKACLTANAARVAKVRYNELGDQRNPANRPEPTIRIAETDAGWIMSKEPESNGGIVRSRL